MIYILLNKVSRFLNLANKNIEFVDGGKNYYEKRNYITRKNF